MDQEFRIKKPSKLLIIIPSIILLVSLGLLCYVVGSGIKNMMNISNDDTVIEAPGTKEITFNESGKYTVFLQTCGVKNGEYYSIPENIQGLSFKVYNENTNIGVLAPTMDSTMSSGNNEFSGVFEFIINTPGTYTVEANIYSDEYGNVLLSVQKSNVIFKFIGGLFIGVISFIIGMVLFIGFLIYWIIKNQKYKQFESQQKSNEWSY